MRSRNPGHVTINNRRVKVQKWHLNRDNIEIAMLVHGYQSGHELLEQLGEESISLQWDDVETQSVRPELSNHQMTGDGPATVHRIEATLWLQATDLPTESLEARLQRIEAELKQVQAELQELRLHRGIPTATRSQSQSLRQSLEVGQTLIDTDIDIDE